MLRYSLNLPNERLKQDRAKYDQEIQRLAPAALQPEDAFDWETKEREYLADLEKQQLGRHSSGQRQQQDEIREGLQQG